MKDERDEWMAEGERCAMTSWLRWMARYEQPMGCVGKTRQQKNPQTILDRELSSACCKSVLKS